MKKELTVQEKAKVVRKYENLKFRVKKKYNKKESKLIEKRWGDLQPFISRTPKGRKRETKFVWVKGGHSISGEKRLQFSKGSFVQIPVGSFLTRKKEGSGFAEIVYRKVGDRQRTDFITAHYSARFLLRDDPDEIEDYLKDLAKNVIGENKLIGIHLQINGFEGSQTFKLGQLANYFQNNFEASKLSGAQRFAKLIRSGKFRETVTGLKFITEAKGKRKNVKKSRTVSKRKNKNSGNRP